MRVLVAMSGGVDSSVAAALLVEQGHEVVGATLKLWGGESDSGCCSVRDVDDARRVAQVLGIDHVVFSYAQEFEERVVTPYVEAHARALTPNPCIDCNRHVKFDLLLERARRLGFDRLATGHHARLAPRDGAARLWRGADPAKDQSYVLAFLEPERLARLVLPVGEMSKARVREEAHARGLRTWDKPDSQEVCFIESTKGRAGFLASRLSLTPATVVDRHSGAELGSVEAAELVTVGQRRGLEVAPDGQRRYVTHVDLDRARVEVDTLEGTLVGEVSLAREGLVAHEALVEGREVLAQWGAHGRAHRAWWRPGRVELAEPQRPPAPGQALVLYDPEEPSLVLAAATVTR